MPESNGGKPELKDLLDALSESKSVHLDVLKVVLEADSRKLFLLDVLACGVVNRSIALVDGFCLLISNNNYLSAAPLLRIQIDNILRFYATSLVDDPHELSRQLLAGIPLRKIRDREGNKMQDAYLVKCLRKNISWLEDVYSSTSGFVHFSECHIFACFDGEISDAGETQICIGPDSINVPLRAKVEAIQAFLEATAIVLSLVRQWGGTKERAGG
jgi:hypothetical protein